MYSPRVVAFVAYFIGFSECFVPDETSNKLYDTQWQCDAICRGSGGKAELNSENQICKCTLDKHVDGMLAVIFFA
ncbi:hypothetical protein JTB14_005203 [Gonioctena quinquepunctata]|nr:hypothetical protein JTB14_005203 [Gonioctena quinquepunctata]